MLVYLSFRSFIFNISLASSIPEPAFYLQALGIQSLTETEKGFMEPKYLAFSEVMKDTPCSSAENMTTDALGKSVFWNICQHVWWYHVIRSDWSLHFGTSIMFEPYLKKCANEQCKHYKEDTSPTIATWSWPKLFRTPHEISNQKNMASTSEAQELQSTRPKMASPKSKLRNQGTLRLGMKNHLRMVSWHL